MLSLQLVHQEIGPGVRLHEQLPAGHEDVAALAEVVVVHDVVMRLEAPTDDRQQDRTDRDSEGQLDAPVAGGEPGAEPPAAGARARPESASATIAPTTSPMTMTQGGRWKIH